MDVDCFVVLLLSCEAMLRLTATFDARDFVDVGVDTFLIFAMTVCLALVVVSR